MDGDTFQPRPISRAAYCPVPSVAMPPCPLAPVKFSALIERVWAFDKRERLPRFMCKPSKGVIVPPSPILVKDKATYWPPHLLVFMNFVCPMAPSRDEQQRSHRPCRE